MLPTTRVPAAVAVFLLASAAMTAPAAPAAAAPPTWPANPNWQALVPAPTSDSVRAARITRTSGSVTNAGALAGQGTGSTVLTTTSAGAPATIILDFGKEVGGTRFAAVQLTTPGSVTLTGAGVNFKAYRATPDRYPAWSSPTTTTTGRRARPARSPSTASPTTSCCST